MTRRTASLVLAGMLLVSMVGVAVMMPMPFVVESPGLTENTLGRQAGKPVIDIRGTKTYPTSGRLDLTTVSVTSPDYRPRLSEVLAAWVSSEQIVLPRDVVYPPEKSVQDVQKENKVQMVSSQDAAIAAGLLQSGVQPFVVKVAQVLDGTPAVGVLDKGDLIRSIEDTDVGSPQELIDAVRAVAPGATVTLHIERDGKPRTVRLTTEPNPDSPDTARIGVAPAEQPVFDPPISVRIELGQEIGGPSAGLIFSVAIYDLLTPGELLGGRYIAGTGTIDQNGKVGPIGGIQQKISGAYNDGDGATVFLVPADNCEEAGMSELANDLLLVKVATLDDAVTALERIDADKTDQLTRCGS